MNFPYFFLISNFIVIREHKLYMIYPEECSVYSSRRYSAVAACSVLKISVIPSWFVVFKSSVSLLIFCLVVYPLLKVEC